MPARTASLVLRSALVPAAVGALLALSAAPAVAADPPVEFTNTGTDCRNLAVSGDLDPVVARELVPARFSLPDPPTGFVELATCAGGDLDGEPLGPFRLAEAAVNVLTPARSPGEDGTITQDIYALSQLDTDARLSERKRSVGFTSELVDIGFTGGGLLDTRIDASIPWPFSPYTMGADVTPGAPLPGVDIITRIWGLGERGLVVTRNDIFLVRAGAVGVGVATFAPGSPLARLFGTTELRGGAISGRGDFVNVTRIIEPAPASGSGPAAPATARVTARIVRPSAPRRRARVSVSVRGPGRVPLVATVRRGSRADGGLVRTLRGRSPLVWGGLTARGRAVRSGTYTVRVRRASGGPVLGAVRVSVAGRGPTALRR